MGKRGIMIANTGSPDNPSPEAVKRYLKRFLSHPRIVPMNPTIWNVILNCFILPRRSKASSKKYEIIWTDGGFTFVRDHDRLARSVAATLRERGQNAAVAFAMSFGNPGIHPMLEQLRTAGCDYVDVLPLYPQNAYSQAYIVADQVREALASMNWDADCRVIGDYSENEAYLEAVADSVRLRGFDPACGDRLIMGFHSVPRVDIENGDTYERSVKATCNWLASTLEIPRGQWALGYQCRFDKSRKWLDPFSTRIFENWAEEGFDGRLFYVCPNFSADCLETLYDVELDLRFKWFDMLVEHGLELREDSFVYVPCLGASEAHVKVILDVLENPASFI